MRPVATGLLLALAACGESQAVEGAHHREIALSFVAEVDGASFDCASSYAALGASEATMRVSDWRFYVANVALITDDGDRVPLELVDDGMWQTDDIALLDFEDGTGFCSGEGSSETNTRVRGRAPAARYAGVSFEVGLPFALNHADPARQPPPLNVPAMGWFWQTGHKYLKIDLSRADGTAWMVHVGSTGCASADFATPPSEPCERINRATVVLVGEPESGTIVADLGHLLKEADLASDTAQSAPGCMSFDSDAAECAPVFSGLGLAWETGTCLEDCSGQTFFSLR